MDFPELAAENLGLRNSRHVFDLGLDRVVGKVVQIPFVHVGRNGDVAHGLARDVEPEDDRCCYPRRELCQYAVHPLDDIDETHIKVGVPREENPDLGDTLAGGRLDIIDIVGGGDASLHDTGNGLFHVERAGSGEERHR